MDVSYHMWVMDMVPSARTCQLTEFSVKVCHTFEKGSELGDISFHLNAYSIRVIIST